MAASWEGFVMEQIIRHLGAQPEECYFWATYSGTELDLLVVRGSRRYGFEIKRTTSPYITASMNNALSDLHLQSLDIIHAEEKTFPFGKHVRAVAVTRLLDDIQPLK